MHCNYNCRDVDNLERFCSELFALRPLMRTEGDDGDGTPFGLYAATASKASFLYDHRGIAVDDVRAASSPMASRSCSFVTPTASSSNSSTDLAWPRPGAPVVSSGEMIEP